MSATPHPAFKSRTSAPLAARELAAELPRLMARARRLVKSPSDAEDLVHDTIERALCFQSTFASGTNLRAWLFQVQHSVFVTRYRRRKREQKTLSLFANDTCVWLHPEAPSAPLPLSPATQRALDSLPTAFRDVVCLVDLEELSYKEAADALKVPVGTVMSRLFRARRQLASRLSESDRALDHAA